MLFLVEQTFTSANRVMLLAFVSDSQGCYYKLAKLVSELTPQDSKLSPAIQHIDKKGLGQFTASFTCGLPSYGTCTQNTQKMIGLDTIHIFDPCESREAL